MLQDEGWEEGEEEDGEGGDVEEGPSLSVCRVTGGGRSRLTGGQRSGTAITFLPRYISTRSKAERSSNRNVLHAADRIPGSVCHQHRASSGADLQYTIYLLRLLLFIHLHRHHCLLRCKVQVQSLCCGRVRRGKAVTNIIISFARQLGTVRA